LQVGNLKYLSNKTDLPLVQLLGGKACYVTPDNGKSHEEMTTADALAEIATYAAGVGPWKHALVTIDEAASQLNGKTDLAERIQAANRR
jgi:glycerophosphoryl diester phosphodiesterase